MMEVQWNLWSGTQQVEAASAAAMTAAMTTTNSTGSVQSADSFLHYEADYKVLICKEHGYALRNLSTHLRDHHSIPAKARKAIVAKYHSYPLLDPKEISLPPLFGRPFEALAAPIEVFLCDEEECSFISKNCSIVARHCNKAHGWNSTKKDREHWTNIKVQKFLLAVAFSVTSLCMFRRSKRLGGQITAIVRDL